MLANPKPTRTPAEIKAELQKIQALKAELEAYETQLQVLEANATPEQEATATTPPPSHPTQEWKALDTVGDGSCGFNAIALGLGFYFAGLRPVKPSPEDADFTTKQAAFTEQDHAFKNTIADWLKEVKTQWDARNNPILKEFTKADQKAIFNLLYHHFPGKTPEDLVKYQQAMAPILRKYTAQGLKQEVDNVFDYFKNQAHGLCFPSKNPKEGLKIFIPGKGLVAVEEHQKNYPPDTEAYQLYNAHNAKAGDLGNFNDVFGDPTPLPHDPIDANTSLESAKLIHEKYMHDYHQSLQATSLTQLEQSKEWLSARGMRTCRDILHTTNVPFEINPVQSLKNLQLLQRQKNSANPLNLHIKNFEDLHWELLKEEQACAAIHYPGCRFSNTPMLADTDNDANDDTHPVITAHMEDSITERQMFGFILIACAVIGFNLAWAPVVIGLLGIVGGALIYEHTLGTLYNTYCPTIMDTFATLFSFLRGNTPTPALAMVPPLATPQDTTVPLKTAAPEPSPQPEATSVNSRPTSPAK